MCACCSTSKRSTSSKWRHSDKKSEEGINQCGINEILKYSDLDSFDVFRVAASLAWSVHPDQPLRVCVDTKRNLLVFVVVNCVEMLQECLPKDHVLVVEFVKFVLND